MSPGTYFTTLTPLRKAAAWSCVIWFLVFLYLDGPTGVARLILQRTVLEIVLIQGVNAIFSSFVIVELLRVVSKRAALWTDRVHFSVVAVFWPLLTTFTTAGVLLARSSGALT